MINVETLNRVKAVGRVRRNDENVTRGGEKSLVCNVMDSNAASDYNYLVVFLHVHISLIVSLYEAVCHVCFAFKDIIFGKKVF